MSSITRSFTYEEADTWIGTRYVFSSYDCEATIEVELDRDVGYLVQGVTISLIGQATVPAPTPQCPNAMRVALRSFPLSKFNPLYQPVSDLLETLIDGFIQEAIDTGEIVSPRESRLLDQGKAKAKREVAHV